jgi:hypothetical protein
MTTELFDKVNFKKCPRNDCSFNGTPQPRTDFYKGRPECKTCSRRIGKGGAPTHRCGQHAVAPRSLSTVNAGRSCRSNRGATGWRITSRSKAPTHCRRRSGIHERAVWRWLNESATADLDAVDRALCNRGTPWVLRELYPHIYDLPELEEAA